MNLEELNTCPRCGKEFNCSKSGKCWCFELQIADNILDAINLEYDLCLCKNCLKELVNKNS